MSNTRAKRLKARMGPMAPMASLAPYIAFLLLAAFTALMPQRGDAQTPPQISLRQVVSGFSLPVEMVAANDGTGRMFVVEQSGRIKVIEGVGTATPTVRASSFLDISSGVISTNGGERGLLGLAFHPQYKTLGLFYIFYTRVGDGALVVARLSRSASDPNTADASSRSEVIVVPHSSFANHNAGKIAFDSFGHLVIATGDGGSGGDPERNSQNRGNRLGKLLRISVGAGAGYTIPSTNPYSGSSCAAGTCPEIWHYGLRNPWRFSFDRALGDLYIGDVGQNEIEEIAATTTAISVNLARALPSKTILAQSQRTDAARRVAIR
jgi:glucose/arabinose dehydrogenase